MFIAALFMITKTWNQPKYPSVGEWIKKSDIPVGLGEIVGCGVICVCCKVGKYAMHVDELILPVGRLNVGKSYGGNLHIKIGIGEVEQSSARRKDGACIKPREGADLALLLFKINRDDFSEFHYLFSPIM